MSGRLIILPKKSWHVGKRENIEKVLRDERIAEEEAAAARERGREIAQEGIVETLVKKRSACEGAKDRPQLEQRSKSRKRRRKDDEEYGEGLGGTGQGWGAVPAHVNLFSEAEREAGKRLGQNADHQREKREEELRNQQRSGLAPTALGEGSAELSGADAQPWYSQAIRSSARPEAATRTVRLGREVMGKEAEAALKRDAERKVRADPLGPLFRSRTSPAKDNASRRNVLLSGTRAAAGNSRRKYTETPTSAANDVTKDNSDRKRSKKHKMHKKDKEKKKRDKKKSRRGGSGFLSDGVDVPRGGHDDSEESGARQKALEELRRRRLAREGGERGREIRLLAEREMAGRSLPDERSMKYNNQYNRLAARQNRR